MMFEKTQYNNSCRKRKFKLEGAECSGGSARVGKKAETITPDLSSRPIKSGGYSKLAKQIFGGNFSANQD